jgi:hypothetical protein
VAAPYSPATLTPVRKKTFTWKPAGSAAFKAQASPAARNPLLYRLVVQTLFSGHSGALCGECLRCPQGGASTPGVPQELLQDKKAEMQDDHEANQDLRDKGHEPRAYRSTPRDSTSRNGYQVAGRSGQSEVVLEPNGESGVVADLPHAR